MLVDLGSTSGTVVGSLRLVAGQPYLLALGERVRIGPFEVWLAESPADPGGGEEPTPGPEDVPRPRYKPCGDPSRQSDWLLDLPAPFQQNQFLGRFLAIFETIWEPLEQRQDHVASYFDPRTAPLELLSWIGSWIDAPFDEGWPEAVRRRVLRRACELFAERGTKHGLATLIRVFTGLDARVNDDPEEPFVFSVSLRLDGRHATELDLKLVERLIVRFKPACCAFTLDTE